MNGNKNEPTDEKKTSDEALADPIKISQDDLNAILLNHKKWIESGRTQRERADLSETNLKNLT